MYSYDADFVKKGVNLEIMTFTLTFHYFEDALSLNNSNFNAYIDVIYPKELEIKHPTYTYSPKWANYLEVRLECDEDGRFYTQLYNKRGDLISL